MNPTKPQVYSSMTPSGMPQFKPHLGKSTLNAYTDEDDVSMDEWGEIQKYKHQLY